MLLHNIEARDLPDAWFMCLYEILKQDNIYTIDRGSYKGQQRLEFDYITIHIKFPGVRPLLPEIPSHLGVPNPVADGYLDEYLPYLMTSVKHPGEEYTYGSRLEHQIEQVINMYKKDGHGTNQAIMEIGIPTDVNIEDPPCVPFDTIITTEEGFKRADAVVVGDMVLTHKGRFKKVLKVYNRQYSGNINTLFVKGFNYSVSATSEHPILSMAVERCPYDSKLMCRPNCKKRISSYEKNGGKCPKVYEHYTTDWQAISNLTTDYYIPISKLVIQDTECIYSDEEMYLFGLFLAEGDYIKKDGLRFNLGIHEQELIDKVVILMHDLYDLEPHFDLSSQGSCRISFYSRNLVFKYYKLFGKGARTKVIPMEFINFNSNKLCCLVTGYIDGDGSYRDFTTEWFTTSKSLNAMFKLILQKQRKIPSCCGVSVKDSVIDGRTIKSNGDGFYFSLLKNNRKRSCYFEDDNYMYVPVKNNYITAYNGSVFNYEVEEDNSYVANGLPVHNCLRVIDTRIKDNKLSFVVYFRSWDLYSGLPANLGAIQLMKEYMASEIGVEDGEIIASSKGLHLYDYVWDIAKQITYKEI